MRRKDRKWSTFIPRKWMGFSRLLPSTLSDCVCGSAKIASKGVPGMSKPFLRTLKSVFSTYSSWKGVVIICLCEDRKYTLNTAIWKLKSLSRREAGFSMLVPAEAWGSPVGMIYDGMSKDGERAEVSSDWDIATGNESYHLDGEGRKRTWLRPFLYLILRVGRLDSKHCLIDLSMTRGATWMYDRINRLTYW